MQLWHVYSKLTFGKSRDDHSQTGGLANPAHPFTSVWMPLMSPSVLPVFCGQSSTYQNCVQISLANRNTFFLGLGSKGFTREISIFVTGAWNASNNLFHGSRAIWGVAKWTFKKKRGCPSAWLPVFTKLYKARMTTDGHFLVSCLHKCCPWFSLGPSKISQECIPEAPFFWKVGGLLWGHFQLSSDWCAQMTSVGSLKHALERSAICRTPKKRSTKLESLKWFLEII